jgi:hypothetical protein
MDLQDVERARAAEPMFRKLHAIKERMRHEPPQLTDTVIEGSIEDMRQLGEVRGKNNRMSTLDEMIEVIRDVEWWHDCAVRTYQTLRADGKLYDQFEEDQ